VLAHLKHPYIIGYMTYFIVGSHLNIVLEYAAGGDLSQRIKRQKDVGSPFAEDDILVWFAQVIACIVVRFWTQFTAFAARSIRYRPL
jgi:serine/threonine protein kinase